MIIQRFKPGDRVDYVYKGLRGGSGPGGQYGAPVSTKGKSIVVPQAIPPFAGIPGTGAPAPGGGFQLAIPGTSATSAFQKAVEEGKGVRRRGVVDSIMDPHDGDSEVRVLLYDSMDYVWAHPAELEALDAVSQLGDVIGPNGRGLNESLTADDTRDTCKDCGEEITGEVMRMGFSKRCVPCHERKLGK